MTSFDGVLENRKGEISVKQASGPQLLNSTLKMKILVLEQDIYHNKCRGRFQVAQLEK